MNEMLKKFFTSLSGLLKKETDLPRPLRRESYDRKYASPLRDWLIYHQKEIVFDQMNWMGTKILKNPMDAWIYQEILYEVRPDIVVEIGSNYGGSTKYFANLLDIIGKGQVISIDIDRTHYNLEHDRVITLTGNSSDPAIVSQVEALCQDKTVFVIQDGDHSKAQVLADLENYSGLVSLNSYFIVEDGIVDLFHDGDGMGFKEEEPGPLAAVEEFLNRNDNFVIDNDRERYILTYNPKGFLRRVG